MYKYLIILGLLLSGCISTTYPEYKFGDKVEVIKGFYAGCKGDVTHDCGNTCHTATIYLTCKKDKDTYTGEKLMKKEYLRLL